MIDLPPDLAPWASLLGLFPPEVAASLGPWVQDLDRLIGPLRAARPLALGEPDGFHGIARRGNIERLLLSEWLLADEAPDEFARRAAMHELAYLEIARRSPARAQSSVVLFEAGPSQIGSPRIVHLAALIVLARRAERQGARFSWGLLHDPAAALLPEVTRQSVLRLLSARTAFSASAEAIAAWAARATGEGWEDLWIIGRGALPEIPNAPWPARCCPSFLDVNDVLDPQVRAVQATALTRAAPPREISLPLPAPRASARLLRDPFIATAAAPRATQKSLVPTSNLVFATNATKVLARGAPGEVIAYPIPNSPRAPAGRPRRYRTATGGVVAGAAWAARGLAMLVITDEWIIVEHSSTGAPASLPARVARPANVALTPSSEADPLMPLLFRPYGPRMVTLGLDARGTLFEISTDFDPPVTQIATGVTAAASLGRHVSYVCRGQPEDEPRSPGSENRIGRSATRTIPPTANPVLGPGHHYVRLGTDRGPGEVEAYDSDGPFHARFGYTERGPIEQGLVAIQDQRESWSIRGSIDLDLVFTPAGTEVVGAYHASEDTAPRLVIVDADRRAIRLHGPEGDRTILRAPAEITAVTQSTTKPYLAYATTTGEVVVVSLLSPDAPLARFVPSAGD